MATRITQLVVENVKRVKVVTINPDGSVVRIRGENGEGKSSVLDSIAYALGGEKLCPAEPIRRGAESARVEVSLSNGWKIERRWTKRGSYLKATTKDGASYGKPQKILDDLVGRLSFDPLEFLRLKPTEQQEKLRGLAGVDTSMLDRKRRELYELRTGVNRDVAQLSARLSSMPEVEAPDQPVSSAELLAEHQRRQAQEAEHGRRRNELRSVFQDFKRAQDDVARQTKLVDELEERIRREKSALAVLEVKQSEIRQRGNAMKAEVDALVPVDLEEIPAQLRELEAVNDRVRAKQQRQAVVLEIEKVADQAEQLSAAIGVVDDQKARILEQAKFPVEGLGFSETGVTFRDLPLEQSSQAEQIRVSMAMAIALSPKLPIALIHDGSLLDEHSLQIVTDMAEKAGAQVWLEVVGKDGAGIVIEDGMVDGQPPAEAVNA